MYPFERFSDASKKVLTAAQGEAESRHHRLIGSEHLLMALALNNNSPIEAEAIKKWLDALEIERSEVVVQVIPTSAVKNIISLAFEEAADEGAQFVEPRHMLQGIMLEEESRAAHMLSVLYGLDYNAVKASA